MALSRADEPRHLTQTSAEYRGYNEDLILMFDLNPVVFQCTQVHINDVRK